MKIKTIVGFIIFIMNARMNVLSICENNFKRITPYSKIYDGKC